MAVKWVSCPLILQQSLEMDCQMEGKGFRLLQNTEITNNRNTGINYTQLYSQFQGPTASLLCFVIISLSTIFVFVSEMTYTVSSGTLNSTIPYPTSLHTSELSVTKTSRHWSTCMECSVTACHFCSFTSCFRQSSEDLSLQALLHPTFNIYVAPMQWWFVILLLIFTYFTNSKQQAWHQNSDIRNNLT